MMSRLPRTLKLVPSILDRLLGPDYEESCWSPEYHIENELKAVQRDLEDLLNSHPPVLRVEGGSDVLKNSLLMYGLPDLASLSIVAGQEKTDVGTVLKSIIERCEPRLREVRVTPIKEPDDLERRLRYRIDARLRVEPAPDVNFETVFELATGQAKVTPGKT
jgi:type VI secretion system protein ImpF